MKTKTSAYEKVADEKKQRILQSEDLLRSATTAVLDVLVDCPHVHKVRTEGGWRRTAYDIEIDILYRGVNDPWYNASSKLTLQVSHSGARRDVRVIASSGIIWFVPVSSFDKVEDLAAWVAKELAFRLIK